MAGDNKMKRLISHHLHFSILFFILFLAGCVSVSLSPSSSPQKSKDVELIAPSKPFKEGQSASADQIWESKKTASTISYYSSCSDEEPYLKSIRSSSLQGIEDYKITKEETVQINAREGLRTTVDGKLEGVPVRLEVLVFTKNSCSYQLTYVSLKENYSKEIGYFNKFINDFKVK